MNSFLLNRQLGSVSQQSLAKAQNNRLLHSLQAAPNIQFTLRAGSETGNAPKKEVAHGAGVSSIAIERFEGR